MSWFSNLFSFGRGKPKDIKRSLQTIIKEELKRAKAEIGDNMRMYGRNASGKSVKGLKVRVSNTTGYIDAPESWNWMERGRGPGGGGVGWAIYNAIRKWIIDKGISVRSKRKSPSKQLHDTAWAISHSIINNGTRLHREYINGGTWQNIYTAPVKRAQERIAKQSTRYVLQSLEEIFKIENSD